MVEKQFFESLPKCLVHKNILPQDWFVKETLPKISYGGKTLGGADLSPPGQLGIRLVTTYFLVLSQFEL